MCGIVGFRDASGSVGSAQEVVRRMAMRILHRGPDDDGVWTDGETGIALAQRRLAIVDLSPSGHQPMFSACGRYVIVFNGEIYNHASIRAELDQQGRFAWRGHSDTEVLIGAIVHWGLKEALARCVGMFAVALWDRTDRTLILARDRLGEKPLYFGRIGKTFAFASELKAFRAHPDWNPQVNRDALTLFMRHNYIPAPYSIYRNIEKLRPGHILFLESGSDVPRIETYWKASDAAERGMRQPFEGSRDEAVDQLDQLLRQSLRDQMVADVPLGAFLSGGVDSSTVVATMQSMSTRPIRTFTIGFHQKDYNEAIHAQEVARHLGTDHTELYVTERDALNVIPHLPSIYCEPFADSSQIPTYLVSKLARQHVTVSLSGDGGDELFSGYTRYGIADLAWKKLAIAPVSLRQVAAKLAMLPSPTVYDMLANPLMRLMPANRRQQRVGDKIHKAASVLALKSSADVYRRLCSHWTEPEDVIIGGHELPTMLTDYEPLPVLNGNVERMMFTDLVSYLPDDILVKVDRAAMGVSLEARVPFLDHRIVEFAMTLPLSVLRAGNTPKWPLRQLLYRHVPKTMVERPKMGFGVPIDLWLRGELREWAEDLLDDSRLRSEGYFNSRPIRQLWEEHVSGRRNHQYLLWDVLMFQAWNAEQNSGHAALAA
ncbi:asparagine synthase (glutamine-hydrolyzing) [Pseudaminobacter sp. NGMCC 1.201702]|uniref:asparagine synthase (glutamine-hydrolyzing) n=1 Tax=Pseudaminobacter sp. NGMCC 1.201702 TaxID=3391825 RepID=UPI0039EF4B66